MNIYHVRLKTHLSPNWHFMPSILSFDTGYDAAGSPVTNLTLQVVDRAQLIGILCELHELNLDILSLEFVNSPNAYSGSLIS